MFSIFLKAVMILLMNSFSNHSPKTLVLCLFFVGCSPLYNNDWLITVGRVMRCLSGIRKNVLTLVARSRCNAGERKDEQMHFSTPPISASSPQFSVHLRSNDESNLRDYLMPHTHDHISSLDASDGSLDSRIGYVCFVSGLVHVRDRKLDRYDVAS
jgi:hypothetical protein